MKETTFIENNKEKWVEFERLSEKNSTDPDKLSDLFIELTEDLSYAKTFYPKRSVRVYLNYLAQKVFFLDLVYLISYDHHFLLSLIFY